jgi:hypothetical protein
LAALGCHRTQDGALEAAGTGKDIIRALHDAQRIARLRANRKFIAERLPELIVHFATGSDIDPARISPVLKKVSSDSWESDLFRLASLTWAIPVSNGFGRRLRYLVWDEHNDKLIGLIAIGDPVFNLSVRDRLITWNHRSRGKRLVNMMDAYVLGAVPPYNMLLGGWLPVSFAAVKFIRTSREPTAIRPASFHGEKRRPDCWRSQPRHRWAARPFITASSLEACSISHPSVIRLAGAIFIFRTICLLICGIFCAGPALPDLRT